MTCPVCDRTEDACRCTWWCDACGVWTNHATSAHATADANRRRVRLALLHAGFSVEGAEAAMTGLERAAVRARERELAQMARDTGTNALITFAAIIEGTDEQERIN